MAFEEEYGIEIPSEDISLGKNAMLPLATISFKNFFSDSSVKISPQIFIFQSYLNPSLCFNIKFITFSNCNVT